MVEKVFVVCCMLHNIMLSEMESRELDVQVGHGRPHEGDGLWLRGNERQFGVDDNRLLATMWGKRRARLADHIFYCAKLNKQK